MSQNEVCIIACAYLRFHGLSPIVLVFPISDAKGTDIMALWGGRFAQETNKLVAELSESISFDQRLYAHDILGSQAHARMLAKQGIIPAEDAQKICAELDTIRAEIDAGDFV